MTQPAASAAYYFSAGEFHFPVSGFTHLDTSDGIKWSAYRCVPKVACAVESKVNDMHRFHEMDPLVFSDGLQLVWRNGDTVNPATGKFEPSAS